MIVVTRIDDEAVSGAVLKTRPGVLRLMELVKSGEIDVIVCTSPDRLTRDPELNERLLKLLPFYNVEVHYTQSGGPMSALEQRVHAMLSAQQLRDVGIKTWQGQKGHHLRGKAVAGLAYGYSIDIHHDANGDRIPGLRKINEAEAEIVRRIFKDYSLGLSPVQIAKDLNEQGIPGPSGLKWRDTAIRGHKARGTGILNNETYIGRRVWNRQRYLKNPETDKRNSRINPSAKLLTVEVPHLRIVDQQTWDLVKVQQSIRTKNTKEGAGNRLTGNKRPAYLLSGLVECGTCKGPYAVMSKDRYGCTNHRKHLGCDNARTISRRNLEERVNSAIPDALLNTSTMGSILARIRHAEECQAGQRGNEEKLNRGKLRKLEKQIENLLTAIRSGLLSPSVAEALTQAEAEKARLKNLLENDLDTQKPELPNLNLGMLPIATRALARAATEGAEATEARQWRQLVRTIIERVVVHPLPKKGVALEVHGQLAVLLAAVAAWNAEEARFRLEIRNQYKSLKERGAFHSAQDRLDFIEMMNNELEKRKRSFERFQSTVVAGAGFEPATFRL